MAVEVVLDRNNDGVRLDCAYTDPLTLHFVDNFLVNIEQTTTSLLKGDVSLSRPLSDPPKFLSSGNEDDDSTAESSFAINEENEAKVRIIISQFLDIEQDKITPTTSLISMGLDSIKSIGLSRLLKKEGFGVSALDIMRRPVIRRIAAKSNDEENSTGAKSEIDRLIQDEIEQIENQVDRSELSLGGEDTVRLYLTTALQAGMLSQVSRQNDTPFLSANIFTDCKF